ncbi:MAG TPA: NADH:flavin oxidoreductase [Armatimonadota bacterium]|nr:NADH:flavin oxidoreductase [Armatimonadota bacterium]
MARLFDPIDLHPSLRLKNRVVMPPMLRNHAGADGVVTQEVIQHYVARADGGVGLIIVEATYVREDGKLSPRQLGISKDTHIEPLSRLAGAIREHGAAAAIQIHHAGGVADPKTIGGHGVAPSADAFPGPDGPRELTTAEAHQLAALFGAAAGRARAAGFDAVELHGAHGFLVNQFLSPATNHRHDQYGGGPDGRLRFALECVQAMREAAGNDYPIIVRISAIEERPNGLTLEDSCQIARALESAGACAIHVSASLSSPRDYEPGHLVPLAAGIKQAVSVPIIAVGKLHDPELANRVIEEGRADLVAVGSQLLKQPDWPQRAAAVLDQEV